MKKSGLGFLATATAALGLTAFTAVETGSIKGTFAPANSVNQVWAVSGTDTLKVTPDSTSFNFDQVKSGKYTVLIDAKEPLKDKTVENVEVKAGQAADLGVIKLEQ
jgi:hypothetical protein